MFNLFIESRLRHDAVQTLYEHKILEHSMQIVRPNTQLILPNSKILGRKIKTIGKTEENSEIYLWWLTNYVLQLGDKLREMNVFAWLLMLPTCHQYYYTNRLFISSFPAAQVALRFHDKIWPYFIC